MASQEDDAQIKTFTKWVNAHLLRMEGDAKGVLVKDLQRDLQDGTVLIRLIHSLYPTKTTLPTFNQNPKMRTQYLDNVTLALQMLEQAGITIPFLKPANIVDGDLKMILGLIWVLILENQVQAPLRKLKEGEVGLQSPAGSASTVPSQPASYDTATPQAKTIPEAGILSPGEKANKGINREGRVREALLHWVQRQLVGYPVTVTNFDTDFRSGIALAALVHKLRPDLVNLQSLLKDSPEKRIQTVYDIAQREMDIPALLEVEDVLRASPASERSIITYVSEFLRYYQQEELIADMGKEFATYTAIPPISTEASTTTTPAAPSSSPARGSATSSDSIARPFQPPAWAVHAGPSPAAASATAAPVAVAAPYQPTLPASRPPAAYPGYPFYPPGAPRVGYPMSPPPHYRVVGTPMTAFPAPGPNSVAVIHPNSTTIVTTGAATVDPETLLEAARSGNTQLLGPNHKVNVLCLIRCPKCRLDNQYNPEGPKKIKCYNCQKKFPIT